jgi:PAS domain-containing protein
MCADGKVLPLPTTPKARWKQHAVVGVVCIAQPDTMGLQAAQDVRDLHYLLANAGPVLAVGLGKCVTFWNPKCVEITSLPVSSAVQRRVEEILHPTLAERIVWAVEKIARNGVCEAFETEHVMLEGDNRPTLWR